MFKNFYRPNEIKFPVNAGSLKEIRSRISFMKIMWLSVFFFSLVHVNLAIFKIVLDLGL